MTTLLRSTVGLLLYALLAAASGAAEPEFTTGIVTESRVYERQAGSVRVGGFETARATVATSRVTVAVAGERITGEWEPKTTTISATAKDFRRGAEVPVAATRRELLLKHPDGSLVRARIVKRERPPAGDGGNAD